MLPDEKAAAPTDAADGSAPTEVATPPEVSTPAVATGNRRRAATLLALAAVLLGLALMAAGQYALDDSLQDIFEKRPPYPWLRLSFMPRLGPGVVGIVSGALLAGLGLRRLAPERPAESTADPPAATERRGRRLLGWALVGAGMVASAVLSAHLLLTDPGRWDEEMRVLFLAFARPIVFGLSILLGGIGFGLLGRPRGGPAPRFGLLDAAWVLGAIALFVGLTAPTLESWRYSAVGDEYGFYQVAYELYSGRTWDMFWQAGVYGTHPLMSSWVQALAMRLFGDDIFGWKMGGVLAGAAAIPPTYVAARWLFDRPTAQVAAAVVATSHYLFSYAHTGYNNIDAVLPTVLTATLIVVALVRPSRLVWYAAGAAAGLSLYFFFAARVAGPMLALGLLQRGRRRLVEGLLPALIGCLIVAAPFAARNQLEMVTKMLAESAATKDMPLDAVALESLKLLGLSALAFHWSAVRGHYLSLGLFDPFTAVLSTVGLALALLRWRDWRYRLLLVWYLAILLITSGATRHTGISETRLLVAVPLLALLVGRALSALLHAAATLFGTAIWRPLAVLSMVLFVAATAFANVHRFRVVTPARNESPPEMLVAAALYSPECRAAGRIPILIWSGRGGIIMSMVAGFEPNRYEPIIVTEEEYRQVPAYQRWPCAVAYDPAGPFARRMTDEATRRDPSARVVEFRDDGARRAALALLQPGDRADATPPADGRWLYAVHHTNWRRGSAPGALDESVDLAVAPNGHPFVTDRGNRRVTEFDADWVPVALWGGRSVFQAPIAAAADGERLVVLDAGARRLVELGADRRVRRSRTYAELGLGAPRALAFDRSGNLIVADEAQAALILYDRELEGRRALMDPSTDPDRARPLRPTDVRVGADDAVFAYEASTAGRVRKLRPDGTVVATWEVGVREGRLAVAPDGSFWVGGPHGRGLARFGADGNRIAEFPPTALLGGVGEGGVTGLAVDERGEVAVAWRYPSVVVYRPTP
ncbi:MAG TPA: glycosyltransferase family 39 protein [Chloroflexota bacterium]|nr:glycosyltransferase family 39 protein [Chloroflexota bacterium]